MEGDVVTCCNPQGTTIHSDHKSHKNSSADPEFQDRFQSKSPIHVVTGFVHLLLGNTIANLLSFVPLVLASSSLIMSHVSLLCVALCRSILRFYNPCMSALQSVWNEPRCIFPKQKSFSNSVIFWLITRP